MGADPIHPYSALPVLTAFLKAHGYHDVVQRDIGIEALDYLMTPDYLRGAETLAMKKFSHLSQKGSLTAEEKRSYQMMGRALRNARYVIENIDKAKTSLRSEDFYNARKMSRSKRTLNWAYNLLSSAFHPTILASGTFVMPSFSYQNSEEIIASGRQNDNNPLIDYYHDQVLDWLDDHDPDVIGISITYQSQLTPALALARVIKEAGLRAHVTLGGGFVSWLCHFPAGIRALLEFADSLIINEGETALLELVRTLEQKKDVSALGFVRNIIFRSNGQVIRGPWQMEDMDQIATPMFEGLFNGKYLAPDPIHLYQTSRGCYAKCAFCCVSIHQKENGYRRRSLDLIVEDIKKISRHTPEGEETYLFIADDTHSPAHLRYLARRLLEEGLTNVRWMCEARLDKGFSPETCDLLYEAGLRLVFFGMESANQRVLDTMMKGTYLRYMSEGIINTARAGIGSYVSLVIGFPTETEDEARDTVDFIMEHAPYILTVGFNPFVLPWGSYVHMRPEQFGVTLKSDPKNDIQIIFDYDVKTGISAPRAHEIALDAQRQWYEQRTRPIDFSLSLFDGYTLLYLSRHGLHFVEDQFADVESVAAAQKKAESLQYVPEAVWSNMAEIS
jgi:hypothetical protein